MRLTHHSKGSTKCHIFLKQSKKKKKKNFFFYFVRLDLYKKKYYKICLSIYNKKLLYILLFLLLYPYTIEQKKYQRRILT